MARKSEPICETEKEPFPTALRGLIKEKGITQKALAEALGVTRQAIDGKAKFTDYAARWMETAELAPKPINLMHYFFRIV